MILGSIGIEEGELRGAAVPQAVGDAVREGKLVLAGVLVATWGISEALSLRTGILPVDPGDCGDGVSKVYDSGVVGGCGVSVGWAPQPAEATRSHQKPRCAHRGALTVPLPWRTEIGIVHPATDGNGGECVRSHQAYSGDVGGLEMHPR